jgi:hypothetical protein
MENILNIYFSSDVIKYCILPYLFNNTKGARRNLIKHQRAEKDILYDMTHTTVRKCIICGCKMFQSGMLYNNNNKKCIDCNYR